MNFKPCRKCGKQSVRLTCTTDDTDGILHYQWHAVCECGNNTFGHETKEKAVKAWNRQN